MDEQRLKRFAVPAIIGLVLVGIVGSMAYQSGWSQGFTLGLLTSGREGAAAVAPYMMHGGHMYGGHFGFFGGILRFFFALLFIGFIFKAVRCLFWRMGGHGGHHGGWGNRGWGEGGSGEGGPQHTHWHRHHSPWGPRSGGPQNGPSQAKESSPQSESANRQEPIMYV